MNLFCLLSWLYVVMYETYSAEGNVLKGSFLQSEMYYEQPFIHRFDLESNDSTLLQVPENDVSAFAYDYINHRIYYGSTFSIHVYSMYINGSDVRLEATISMYAQAIAIDLENWYLFILIAISGTITKVDLRQDPSIDRSQVIIQHEPWPYLIMVDHMTRRLIMANSRNVFQADYNGTGTETLVNITSGVSALAYDSSYIYIVEEQTFRKVDRQNLSTTTFFLSSKPVRGLVAVDNYLYYVDLDLIQQPYVRTIRWVSKDGMTNGTVGTFFKSCITGSHPNFAYAPTYDEQDLLIKSFLQNLAMNE